MGKQAVMHYSRHGLTASITYVTTGMYASTNRLALLTQLSVRRRETFQPCSVKR